MYIEQILKHFARSVYCSSSGREITVYTFDQYGVYRTPGDSRTSSQIFMGSANFPRFDFGRDDTTKISFLFPATQLKLAKPAIDFLQRKVVSRHKNLDEQDLIKFYQKLANAGVTYIIRIPAPDVIKMETFIPENKQPPPSFTAPPARKRTHASKRHSILDNWGKSTEEKPITT